MRILFVVVVDTCILWIQQLENFKQFHSGKRERHGFTIKAGMVSHSENKVTVNDKDMAMMYIVPQPTSFSAKKCIKYKDCRLLAGTKSTILSFEYDGMQRIEKQTLVPSFKSEEKLLECINNLNSNYNIQIDTNSVKSYKDIAILVQVLAPQLAKVCK